MRLRELTLSNFRNYHSLHLALPAGLSILHGGNAQGKTNLLEAIYLLATTRSPRAASDRELICWDAPSEAPVARVAAKLERADGELSIDIALRAAGSAAGEEISGRLVEKRIRVNGVARRAAEVVGQINVVMFSPTDIDLVGGPPSLRRRSLDITISQLEPRYVRALQRYNRVLEQRNHLLRLIREGQAAADQMAFWDEEAAEQGAFILLERRQALFELDRLVADVHAGLTEGKEELRLAYQPGLGSGVAAEVWGQASLEEVRRLLAQGLLRRRSREIAQGATTLGPHRDDLTFAIGGVDAGVYGSRGQQRTVALALRLAEARLMRQRRGDPPVVLLDDVLSELDATRRVALLGQTDGYQQTILTTTDLPHIPQAVLTQASCYRVAAGEVLLDSTGSPQGCEAYGGEASDR